MKCWICGHIANTREHLLKASDVRSYFGPVSPQRPIYYHSDKKRNIPLLSEKDKRLICSAKICAKCNNERTQPYDKAWESFSKYARDNWGIIRKNRRIDLSKVFPGSSRRQALNVHLYFVKLFGCRIAENDIPINLKKFADCLLKAEAHNEVYLVVYETPAVLRSRTSGLTQVHARNIGDVTESAVWIYTVGRLSMKIGYLAETSDGLPWPCSWHPNKPGKLVKLSKK